MKARQSFLNQLKRRRVTLMIEADAPGGFTHFVLTTDQALRLLKDKNAVLAELWSVSKSDFIRWTNEGYCVHCAGTTKSMRPCRNIVGSVVEASEWLEKQGSLCWVHEDQ